MTDTQTLSPDTLKRWLENSGTDFYLCNQCHGLHLSDLQELEGVVDARLLPEEWGLLISTEFLVRPTALLALAGDLGYLNASYPVLKLFLDVVDDAMPQLVAGATVLTGAGLTEAQFGLFLASTQQAVTHVAGELKRLDFLLPPEDDNPAPGGHRFH